MATSTTSAAARPSAASASAPITIEPARSTLAASRSALLALILRDLVVLWKHKLEFAVRTLIQPFLLVFVFLYVFPTIGQGIGGHGAVGESAFATVLVPGVVGITIMFQGIQAVAMVLAQEFGYTREIEDRVQAPCPIWLVAVSKVLSGAAQGLIAALIVFPMARVIHAPGVHAHLSVTWWIVITLIPLACVTMTSLGLLLGTVFEARNLGLMFGFVVLPLTFLGGTYYQWTKLSPVQVDGVHWLQIVVLINPLIYVNEGLRAGLTHASHMPLYVVYPVLLGFCAVFLGLGLRRFRGRVVS
ncbi:MAG TPA: ABC transporter permease [Solirubrobacteraceae bacterium]|jgi:ABC-2 type transport system permease protein|nr:ABC transporter permease [Solirubrobacteraceae bacterium]